MYERRKDNEGRKESKDNEGRTMELGRKEEKEDEKHKGRKEG